jgi:DNA-binding NarL/FixJ family response regulator
MIRVFLVDDHRLFREGLRALLAGIDDLDLIGEAADASEALRRLTDAVVDVVLVDLALPGTDGISLVRQIMAREHAPKVLALTMHSAPDYVRGAFAAGALGYALKDQSGDELVAAIRTIAAGRRYLAPRLPPSLQEPTRHAVLGDLEALSPREREVFDLAVRGYSNEGIASHLAISVKTVETHRARINSKLGVHSAAELIRFAARRGLVTE